MLTGTKDSVDLMADMHILFTHQATNLSNQQPRVKTQRMCDPSLGLKSRCSNKGSSFSTNVWGKAVSGENLRSPSGLITAEGILIDLAHSLVTVLKMYFY